MRQLRRWFCGYFLGHRWRDEKEFVSCARCHECIAKRDLPGWRDVTR